MIFDLTNKKKRSGLTKKFRSIVKKMAYMLIPLVLLFTFIMILLIGFRPSPEFPKEWPFSDNSCARFATVDKFRVSRIELKYPVTFKITKEQLNDLVLQWIDERQHTYQMLNITVSDKSPEPNLTWIGNEYYFSHFQASSLFGMMNDAFVRVVECDDVWGGVKLEAHSNIRLGLKDYDTNLAIIESLYSFIERNTVNANRSYLLCEHARVKYFV